MATLHKNPSYGTGTTISNNRESVTSSLTHDENHPRFSTLSPSTSSHLMSTLALSTSVVSMMFLIMSAFPYSGFMAMQLVPSLTHESAGTYAGLLSGSFMLGRLFSSYPWGQIADLYGRKFVLIFSNLTSALLAVAFGFSGSFTWAICVRFLMGLGNGIMVAGRVSATELAKGDRELEAKGVGLMMSAIGYGMLLGPALGGVLSEPMKQYPGHNWFGGRFDQMLEEFPFCLPNLFGAVLCVISTLMIVLFVEETLAEEKIRSSWYFLPDAIRWIAGLPGRLWKLVGRSNEGGGYQQINTSVPIEDIPNDKDGDNEVRIFETKDFAEVCAAMSSPSSRKSCSKALRRPSKQPPRPSVTFSDASHVSANMSSLMSNKRIKEGMLSLWFTTLYSSSTNEVFPLFCMAKNGGLALDETQIGIIGTTSGMLFCISQYFIFSYSMNKYGLHQTLVVSSLLCVIPVIFTPAALLLRSRPTIMTLFLGVINATTSIFFSNYNAAITIVINRTVHASDRAKVNGLAAVGNSVGRGIGPLMAGFMVTFSFTSGIVPARFGSVIIYSIVAGIGIIAVLETYKMEAEEEEETKNIKEDREP